MKLDTGLYDLFGKKPPSVALNQNHAIVFIQKNVWIKCQILKQSTYI